MIPSIALKTKTKTSQARILLQFSRAAREGGHLVSGPSYGVRVRTHGAEYARKPVVKLRQPRGQTLRLTGPAACTRSRRGQIALKIAPGVKPNAGSKGIASTIIGGRGASINVGKKRLLPQYWSARDRFIVQNRIIWVYVCRVSTGKPTFN